MGSKYDGRSCPGLCQAQLCLLLSTNIRRGKPVTVIQHSDNPCQHSDSRLDDGILLRVPIHVQDPFWCILDVGTSCDHPLWKDHYNLSFFCRIGFRGGSCNLPASNSYGTRLRWLA